MYTKYHLFESNNNFEKYKDVISILHGKRVENPDISIMIPTYRRTEMLEKAIQSVLNQRTKHKYEIVVVDNDDSLSTDALDIVQKFDEEKVCYYKNKKNIGMFGNWNRCIELAQSKWMLILHDDDELAPGFIEDMLNTAENTNLGAVTCNYQVINENDVLKKDSIKGSVLRKLSRDKVKAIMMKDFYYYCQPMIWGTVFRTAFLKEIGGFDEKQYPCGDTVLLLNYCNKYGIVRNGKTLFYYRWAANESLKLSVQLENIAFNYYMRSELNKNYRFLNSKHDKWYRENIMKCHINSVMTSYNDKKSKVEISEFVEQNNLHDTSMFGPKLVNVLLKMYKLKCYVF